MSTLRRFALIPVTIAALVAIAVSLPLHAQVKPVYSLGASGVLQQIKKLQTTASALHTGAHPDDEDSAFIARIARGDYGRVAYLSLNRGEGGQNVIGSELFEALGVIRTEELLQARALDGGDQFFTRVMDYGFSKTIDEAARKWGEQLVLGDMVRVIRTYRPLVVYSRFSGTPADGHGQHQLVGKLTPLAVAAAADPGQFPEQISKEGLRPWKVRKLYRGVGFRPDPANPPTSVVETGRYDGLLGRSYFEIAAEGRSQHKSQEMGVPESRGRQMSGLVFLAGDVAAKAGETNVFDGLDTTIGGLATLAGLPGGALKAELAAIDAAVTQAVSEFDASAPARSVPALATALTAIRAARAAAHGAPADAAARADADFLLDVKERDAVVALQRASGTVIDAVSDQETVAPGESYTATVRSFLAQPTLVKVEGVTLVTPKGWTTAAGKPRDDASENPMARFFRETADRTDIMTVTVPASAAPTTPYWLESPRERDGFVWPDDAPKGKPFADPLVFAEARVVIGGVPVTLRQPVQFRLIDQVRGELRRNVEVVPALSVALDSTLEIVPLDALGTSRRIAVRLQNQSQTTQGGTVRLTLPEGWTSAPAQAAFSLPRKGDRTAVVFTVTSAKQTKAGSYAITAVASVGGAEHSLAMRTLAYPHIQTRRLYAPAQAKVQVFDVKVAPVKVAYVMGSGDQVPDALRKLGLNVTMLDDEALGTADFSVYDTIVVGVRASESRPEFVSNHGRLLDYVRGGGTLVVQYQQPDYAARNLPPLPAQGATRVTDETVPVVVLLPEHPAFTTPNRIVAEDFDGWVQERSLYSFAQFDPQWQSLLEAADPGEAPQRGGELYARIGKGQYVYSSYAWFRQLPAGVPGAYRMVANLVSLGKRP